MSDTPTVAPEAAVPAQEGAAAVAPAVAPAPAAAPAAAESAATSAPAEEAEAGEKAPEAPKPPMAGFPGMLSSEKIAINGGSTTLIYSAPISDRIVLCHFLATQAFPCSFAVCHTAELKKASYVHLYEDRLEWNYASSVCYNIVDNQHVLYLDRDVAQLSTVPDCCRPLFTHCSCCPTGFDSCGEVLFINGEGTCCFSKGGKIWGNPCMPAGPPAIPTGCPCPQLLIGKPAPCLNRTWIYVPFLEDAQELKRQMRAVRQKLVADGIATAPTKPAAAGEQSRE